MRIRSQALGPIAKFLRAGTSPSPGPNTGMQWRVDMTLEPIERGRVGVASYLRGDQEPF